MKRTPLTLSLLSALTLALGQSAMAVNFVWNGNNADWSTGTEWTPGGPPVGGGGNHAFINSGTANITSNTNPMQDTFVRETGAVNQTAGIHSNASWHFIGDTATSTTANYTISGGTAQTNRWYIGDNGGTGTVNISGTATVVGTGSDAGNIALIMGEGANSKGFLNLTGGTATNFNGQAWIGQLAGGYGEVNHSAGPVTITNYLTIGREGATGVYNLTGSGSIAGNRIYVGGNRDANGGAGTMLINTTGTVTAASDFNVATRGGAGTVTIDKGTVNANTWAIIGESHSGQGGKTGTVTQNGGAVNLGATDANGRLWIGNLENGAAVAGTKGEYFLNGGTLASNNIVLGRHYEGVFEQKAGTTYTIRGTGEDSQLGGFAGSKGTWTMQGGTLNAAGNFQIGANGQGDFIQSGGDANFTTGYPVIGRYATGVGTATVTGGTFNQLAAATRLIIGETGKGTLTVSTAGAVTSVGGIAVGHDAVGNGTLQLDTGGSVTSPFIGKLNGTTAINFNGGTVIASANQPEYFAVVVGNPFTPTLTPLTAADLELQVGGVVINTNGFDIATAAPLDGVGGLTKKGAGTLILKGVNTYTGLTTASVGTLQVDGTVAGNVQVDAAATLSGNGTISGSVTVSGGGILSPGTTAGVDVGVLNIAGAVTLNSTSIVSVTINDDTAGNLDQIANTGTFDAGSATLTGTFTDTTFIEGISPATLALAPRYKIVTGPVTGMFGNATLINAADLATLGLAPGSFEVSLSGQRFYVEVASFSLVPIPEANTSLLAGVVGGLFLMRRR